MRKFTVEVELIAPVRRTIEIEAPNVDQAVDLALKQADQEAGAEFNIVGRPIEWTVRSTKVSPVLEIIA